MPVGAPRTRIPIQALHRPTKTVSGLAGYLGRQSAPAGIGAYYQNLPYKQIGIGYYDAVGVTANTFDVTSPTDQELLNLLQSQQPAGPYVPWAERIGDLDWIEVDPTTSRQLFIITQNQLDQVLSATGELVSTITILSPIPSSVTQLEMAFDNSRYEWLKTEAVYAQADVNPVPQIIFLHWGRSRSIDDLKGRDGDELLLSKVLSGALAYPVEVPFEDEREPPAATFQDALVMQFPTDQVRAALISPQEEAADVLDRPRYSIMKTLLFVGVAGGAGYLLYKWLR